MKINLISREDFLNLVYEDRESFLEKIRNPEAFVIKGFYPKREIIKWREKVFQTGLSSEPSWHPLHDGCPDYHRVHDNYPKAHVQSKMHAFYFHGWYKENTPIFDYFREVFEIKNFLAGYKKDHFLKNIPSDGAIARVNIHNYPPGGGYQMEHIDPVSDFAVIQTLIQASQIGEDFQEGGVYARSNKNEKKYYLDQYSEPGDMIVLSPGIPHGVDYIDKEQDFDWTINKGRWMILPIIVNSDYPGENNVKPKQL